MKAAFNFLVLTNPSPDDERERKFVYEEGDIGDESDVELDGNDQLDLDLDSEHSANDRESDLLSDSKDRARSAEDFQ